jgi:hypothetical protein
MFFGKKGHRENLDMLCKLITPLTGIYDKKPIEMQIRQRCPHGRRQTRCIGPFDFYPDSASLPEKQQVNLRTGVCGPEAGFVRLDAIKHSAAHTRQSLSAILRESPSLTRSLCRR